MNHVIAKIKKDNVYKKLYSGESIFNMPEGVENAVEYAPTVLLEDEEWFAIKDFSQQTYCIDLLKNEFRTTDFAMVDRTGLGQIEYICSYENDTFFFQRILKHSIMTKKYFSLGDEVSLKKEKSLVINEYPDAIYRKDKDVLLFKKLQTIAPLFKGIEVLYKEATREETAAFLNNEFIALTNKYSVDKVKTLNRKHIALVAEGLNNFTKKQRREVLDYTHKYYPQLEYNNGVFSIGGESDLKYLLWGIEQRYYTTPITKENRVANSVIPL